MSKQHVYFFVLIVFGFFGSLAHAVQVEKLYSSVVPIESQQEGRSTGFDSALLEVLIKVTGNTEIAAIPGLLKTFLPAESFVETFSYSENPKYQEYLKALEARQQEDEQIDEPLSNENLGEITGSEPDAQENSETQEDLIEPLPYLLEVSFAEAAIKRKLTDLGIPVWGQTRPNSLLWIVTETEGERSLLGDGFFEKQDYLEGVAEEKGIPVFLPVADLEDVSAIDMGDLWALFPGAVDVASRRYRPDAVIMVRLYPLGEEGWSATWSIQHRSIIETGEIVEKDVALIIDELISHTARMFSSRYAVLRSSDELSADFEIEVSNISDFQDYILIQRYLESLPPVSEVKLNWVDLDAHGYSVVLSGSQDQFFEHIDLGKKLVRDQVKSLSETVITGTTEIDFDLLIEQQNQEPDARLVWLGKQ